MWGRGAVFDARENAEALSGPGQRPVNEGGRPLPPLSRQAGAAGDVAARRP